MVTDHSFEDEYITAAVDDHHQGRQTDRCMYQVRMGVINAGMIIAVVSRRAYINQSKKTGRSKERRRREEKKKRARWRKRRGLPKQARSQTGSARLPNRGRLHRALTTTGNSARRCREVRNDSIKVHTEYRLCTIYMG